MSDPRLLRVELLDGTVKFRRIPALEHGVMCRAFGLDPCSCWFDLPTTAYGVGSARGDGHRGRRVMNGYVMRGPRGSQPIGTITEVREGERIPDNDPHDVRDALDLSGR